MTKCAFFRALCMLTGLFALHAAALQAENEAAILARVQSATETQTLEDPSLKPWHLKLAVQLYDDAGKPAETATIEEWWAGPTRHKLVYAAPAYKSTILRNNDGFFHTPGSGSAPYLLHTLWRQVVRPMPTDDELKNTQPELRKVTVGKADLDCVMLTQAAMKIPHPALGLFPTYCLSRNEDVLRISYNFVTNLIVRNRVGGFQKRTVPLDVAIVIAGVNAATAHLVTLETLDDPAPNLFEMTDDLTTGQYDSVSLEGGVMVGHLLSRPDPIYPPRAREAGISGDVILHAIIGTDGHVHDMQLMSAKDGDLAVAAVTAVRQWKYAPYRLNGAPIDVNTSITIHFSFR